MHTHSHNLLRVLVEASRLKVSALNSITNTTDRQTDRQAHAYTATTYSDFLLKLRDSRCLCFKFYHRYHRQTDIQTDRQAHTQSPHTESSCWNLELPDISALNSITDTRQTDRQTGCTCTQSPHTQSSCWSFKPPGISALNSDNTEIDRQTHSFGWRIWCSLRSSLQSALPPIHTKFSQNSTFCCWIDLN